MIKDKYEISLWQDVLVPAANNVPAHYEEEKIATIGSDSMTISCRAIEPKLVENINGTNTFTFKMFYTCKYDSVEEIICQLMSNEMALLQDSNNLFLAIRQMAFNNDSYQNPLLSYLKNEAKIKVKWKNKWYDLVIKGCQQDSSGKYIIYTCTDSFIHELSRIGFDIELDSSLENNQGTVCELAAKVLENTDWTVDTQNSDTIKQEQEEAVYEATIHIPNIDIDELDFEQGSISSESGNNLNTQTMLDTRIRTVDYLPISSFNKLIVTVPADYKMYLRYYDNSKLHLSNSTCTGTTSTFTLPDGTCYFRFVYAKSDDSNFSISDLNNSNKPTITPKDLKVIDETNNETVVILPDESSILIFYNQLQEMRSRANKKYDYFQFAYADTYERETNSQLVINAHCYRFYDTIIVGRAGTLVGIGLNSLIITSFNIDAVSQQYRAPRLVRSQKSILDPLTNKYCNIYKATANDSNFGITTNDIIYGYKEIRYNDATFVNNLILNPHEFTSTNGWIGDDLFFTLYPLYSSGQNLQRYYDSEPKSYLRIGSRQTVQNTGLRSLSSYLPNGLIKGDKYVVRYKMHLNDGDHPGTLLTEGLPRFKIAYTNAENNEIVYFDSDDINSWTREGSPVEWVSKIITCKTSASKSEIYEKSIAINLINTVAFPIWIEDIQFYPFVIGHDSNNNEVRIDPGDFDITSVAAMYYVYYDHSSYNSHKIISIDDLSKIWDSTEDCPLVMGDSPKIVPVYNDNFEMIRSIKAKNSTCFNLLQSIAETFKCWIRFEIDHDSSGRIIYTNTGAPSKRVVFKKEIGEETGVGFIAGIDLKSVQRTIKSDQLVTKTIVTPNNNQFATDGFCTIARSQLNYPRNNFILNFDYYLNQNLMDSTELYKDLYSSDDNDIGYYYRLHNKNIEYDEKSNKLSLYLMNLTKQKSYSVVYHELIDSLRTQIQDVRNELILLTGVDVWGDVRPVGDKKVSLVSASVWGSQRIDSIEIDSQKFLTAVSRANGSYNFTKDSEGWNLGSTRVTMSDYGITVDSHANSLGVKVDENISIEVQTRIVLLSHLTKLWEEYVNLCDAIDLSIVGLQDAIEDLQSSLSDLLDQINNLHLAFNRKYSYFIKEGSWTNQDYIDDDLYFLDASSIAYTSAYPQVTYNISVLRLTALEDFKNKVFNLGDISYIQDTEFFGYADAAHTTPYKEKVLVSEITSNFDEPEKDVLKIQNYRTQFEDLFQRIVSTVQNIQYASDKQLQRTKIV